MVDRRWTMMKACDKLAGAWKLPLFAQGNTEPLVVSAEALDFDVDEGFRSVLGTVADFGHPIRKDLESDEDSDVVNDPGKKRFVCEGQSHLSGEFARNDADANAVDPEVFGGVAVTELNATEHLSEAGGQSDVLNGIEAKENNRPFDGGDLSGEAVESAVNDFEDARHQGGVVRDDVVQLRGVALGVFDGCDDLGGDFGEASDGGDLLDSLLSQDLGV